MNPQVTYGEDLMSRVSYAMLHDDGLQNDARAIINGLNRLAGLAAHAAGLRARDIHEMVVVGNTVMHHILLGLDPTELGAAPFTLATHAPLDVKARELGLKLHPGANLHCMALEAGHVGSDNVGVLVAEAPDQQDDMMLVIDVGTNAEILLGNRERLLSASSPTGPAFEGAQITHGQRAAPGAIERVRIDPATGEPRFQVIGDAGWSDSVPPETIGATGHLRLGDHRGGGRAVSPPACCGRMAASTPICSTSACAATAPRPSTSWPRPSRPRPDSRSS